MIYYVTICNYTITICKYTVSLLLYFSSSHIIVFDGKLYECTIKGEEPKLKETNHVLINCWHPEGIFYIDVVKREYFEDFLLEIINYDKKRIFEGIDEKYLQIIETAESKTRNVRMDVPE